MQTKIVRAFNNIKAKGHNKLCVMEKEINLKREQQEAHGGCWTEICRDESGRSLAEVVVVFDWRMSRLQDWHGWRRD